MNFSFGIVTCGEDPQRIKEVLDSIYNQDIPNYEIIIVGGESDVIRPLDENRCKFTHLTFDETIVPSGWITKKKNIITAHAIHDEVVYTHDYHVFQEGWYKNFLEFGNKWHVCVNAIQNIRGERFRDWVTWDHPDLGRQCEIDYDDDTKIKHQYVSGGHWVAKRATMLFNPLHEGYNRETQYDDVEWSLRIREKLKIVMNKHSIVKHNKPHKETDTRGYFSSHVDRP
jgi:cellulose synthase/poly-beta-1,6-N-acetylglucosamine synthase-like glycosyltransferase